MRRLLLAALLPPALLMVYVFSRDRLEKEPPALLLKLAAFGALSCVPAAFLETVLLGILQRTLGYSVLFVAIQAFLVVALVEEGCKLFFLKRATWLSPEFDFRFDGIVYAVFVSLGFAALENVLYVSGTGIGVAISRGLLAIPGHMTFAVYMGAHYSEARQYALLGDRAGERFESARALWIPVMLHGMYDFLLMTGMPLLALFFFLFVAVLDLRAFSLIRRASRADTPFERPMIY